VAVHRQHVIHSAMLQKQWQQQQNEHTFKSCINVCDATARMQQVRC
jgi:hypothetical protein